MRYVMGAQHKFNPADRRALRIFNLMEQLHQFQVIILGLKILLGLIGTLTLGIGGVGLMNIMLVSVTQRTREIGIEKALASGDGFGAVEELAGRFKVVPLSGTPLFETLFMRHIDFPHSDIQS